MTSPHHPAATRPPLHEVAHLGHVELLTPEPDASLRFFVDVLGPDRDRPRGQLGLPAHVG